MATYTELRNLFNDGDLINRTAVAIMIAVNTKLEATPTAANKAYAAKVFANPQAEAKVALMSVLAANAGATVSAIQGATDASLQTNVNSVVDSLIDALAGV